MGAWPEALAVAKFRYVSDIGILIEGCLRGRILDGLSDTWIRP